MTDLFPDRVETDRLQLTAVGADPIEALDLYEHVREGAPHVEEITEYLTWAPHQTPKETREFLEAVVEEREAGDGVTYVVRPREGEDGAGAFAGLTGLAVDWDTRTGTLGTWLRKRFWGRGYSGERAGALVEVAFERLDLEAVVVSVHEGNEKSRKAVSRYVEAHGGRHEGLLRNFETDGDGSVVDVHRYTITCEEYREATGR